MPLLNWQRQSGCTVPALVMTRARVSRVHMPRMNGDLCAVTLYQTASRLAYLQRTFNEDRAGPGESARPCESPTALAARPAIRSADSLRAAMLMCFPAGRMQRSASPVGAESSIGSGTLDVRQVFTPRCLT